MRKFILAGVAFMTLAAPSAHAIQVEVIKPTLDISINMTTQTMNVTVNGEARYQWRVSTGTRKYRTPTGTYRPYRMHRYWWSRQWDNAPMHWALFFHRGFAIHGTDYIRTLGLPASHGCVRLHPSNASTLFSLAQRHGARRTRIRLHGTPNFAAYEGSRSTRVASYRRRAFNVQFSQFGN